MKQRSFYLTLWMLILCALAFTSCSDDDDDDVTVEGYLCVEQWKNGE